MSIIIRLLVYCPVSHYLFPTYLLSYFLSILISPIYRISFSPLPCGWHPQRESKSPSRITGTEFAILWACYVLLFPFLSLQSSTHFCDQWEFTQNFDPTSASKNTVSWIKHDESLAQGMANNVHITQEFLNSVIHGETLADVSMLAFRDPEKFIAGNLHQHKHQWATLSTSLDNHNFAHVFDWINNYVDVKQFFMPFKGSYKGVNYDCDTPPTTILRNNINCKPFAQFISDTIMDRLASGAVSIGGKVGECSPPHLVMPLTVEPSKPRLCQDTRFLNLWIKDCPFSLDSIQQLPKYVAKDFYQTVCDDKSGYDHILLKPDSRTYFGFQWGGWYFVNCSIPFGWKTSAYIYHTTGLVAAHYLRSLKIPSSLYIDDRHNSQLTFPPKNLPPTYKTLPSEDAINYALANAAIFITCYILVSLGYFIGLGKSILIPSKQVPYLGFLSDSEKQAFTLLSRKKEKFITLVKHALSSDTIDLVTLQRLSGKCISLSLAVPGARLYTNEINQAISRAIRSSRPTVISQHLREELQHWLFLETWDGFLSWRCEKHNQIQLYSDSSSYAWGGTILSPGVLNANISDYWDESTRSRDIAAKETLALSNVLYAFADRVRNSWVDAFVDSQVLIHAWNSQGSRSHALTIALKTLFQTIMDLNIDLHLYYVTSHENLADAPSRRISLQDSKLAPALWNLVQNLYGGIRGHSMDLMARPSNVQSGLAGHRLPFFSECPIPESAGVNVFAQTPTFAQAELFANPYVFPPICLIPHVLKYLNGLHLTYTVVIPDVSPRKFWWPLLSSTSSSCYMLATKGSSGALLTPTKHGFTDSWPIPWDIWVFRIVN